MSQSKKKGCDEGQKKLRHNAPVVEEGRHKCEGGRVKLGKADTNAAGDPRVINH